MPQVPGSSSGLALTESFLPSLAAGATMPQGIFFRPVLLSFRSLFPEVNPAVANVIFARATPRPQALACPLVWASLINTYGDAL